jgi:hypothetical protein
MKKGYFLYLYDINQHAHTHELNLLSLEESYVEDRGVEIDKLETENFEG